MKKFFTFLTLAVLVVSITLLGVAPQAKADGFKDIYDPGTEGVVSGYLWVDRENGYIRGIAPGTTLSQLNTLSLPGDLTTADEILSTGTTLTSPLAGQTLTAVVTGDLNCDGAVTITDLLIVKSAVLGEELTALAAIAGDANYDGEVSISDFLVLKATLLEINQISFANTGNREPIILLTPNGTQIWNVTAASFRSDDATIGVIDQNGHITAGSREGSTFLYALDGSGNVLYRTVLTVLEGGLTAYLEKDTYGLCPGETLQAQILTDHPVQLTTQWESSDTSIFTVSKAGVLTGKAFGTANLTATLPDGSHYTAQVRVMPPITQLDFENHLHKLKPGGTRQLPLILAPLDAGEEIIWASSNPSIVSVTQDGLVTGLEYGTVTITATGKYTGLQASCTVKICNVIQVAITFDDGPSKHTAKLLDWLKENEVKATFFVIGNRMNSYKGTLQRIVNEGHELGYHSYAHKIQTKLDTSQIISDYEKSCSIVKNLTGQTFTVWRAPGGGISDRVLKAIDLPHIRWSVDTLDWKNRKVNYVYNAITSKSDDGEIILLHDLHKTSVEGAIKAMEDMLEGDYEFLTVTELLSRNGTKPVAHKSYKKAPK